MAVMKVRDFNPFWMLIGASIIGLFALLIWLKQGNKKLAEQFANETKVIKSQNSSPAISETSGVVQPMASETFSPQIPENETYEERHARLKREGAFDWIGEGGDAIQASPRPSLEEEILFSLSVDQWMEDQFGEFHDAFKNKGYNQRRLDDFRNLSPQNKTFKDIETMIGNRASARRLKAMEHAKATMTEAEYNEWFENQPASYENSAERKVKLNLRGLRTHADIIEMSTFMIMPDGKLFHSDLHRMDWQKLAGFLRDERGNSQAILNGESGNAFGENADWHAERLAWLDETAGKIGIDLDSGNEVWLDELMADLTKAARESERVEMNRMGIPSHSQVEKIHEALMSQDEAEVKRVLENVGQIITIEQLSNPAPPNEE